MWDFHEKGAGMWDQEPPFQTLLIWMKKIRATPTKRRDLGTVRGSFQNLKLLSSHILFHMGVLAPESLHSIPESQSYKW